MWGRPLPLALLLGVLACGAGEEPPAVSGAEAWPLDGFLHYLPKRWGLAMRLPPKKLAESRPEALAGLFRLLGFDPARTNRMLYGAREPQGLDPARSPGFARTPEGDWIEYLPAKDKAAFNRALAKDLGPRRRREEGDYILLSSGQVGRDLVEAGPLPPGDLAFRLRFHPLLALIASPGDQIELRAALGGVGLALRGRFLTAENSATGRAFAASAPISEPLPDYLPGWLGIRVETALPPTFLAGFLTRRLSLHAGVKEQADRVVIERFLREVLTGLDPSAGFAFGIEFREGTVSCVAYGKLAPGPDSPILAKLRKRDRMSFGPLIVDQRDAPKGIAGWSVWLADPAPRLEGLPETAWPLLESMTAEEEGSGLPVAYAKWEDRGILGIGPRADLLVRAVQRRLAQGTELSPGAATLAKLRGAGETGPVLGVVIQKAGLAELAAADRRALRALFGATDTARPPAYIAICGRGSPAGLELTGRLEY